MRVTVYEVSERSVRCDQPECNVLFRVQSDDEKTCPRCIRLMQLGVKEDTSVDLAEYDAQDSHS